MPLLGGFLIDYMGLTISLLIFQTTIVVGSVVFSIAIAMGNYYVALAGRFLFGLFVESVIVGQLYILWKWFGAK